MLACVASSWATTRIWDGSSNNKWGDTTNWSGGAIPTASDSAIFNSTGNVACSLNVAATCLALKIAASYTQTWKGNGQTLTVATGINDSGITGIHTLPDSVYFSGNGSWRISSGLTNYSGSNTIVCFGGTNDTLADAHGGTMKKVNVQPSTNAYILGPSTGTFISDGYAFILGANSTFTLSTVTLWKRTTSGDLYSIGSGATIAGSGTSTWNAAANNIKVTLPAITWPNAVVTIRGSNTGDTMQFTGNASFGSTLNVNQSTATISTVMDFNDYNISCSIFKFGQTGALTTGYTEHNFGNGTMTCTTFGSAGDSGAAVINMEGCKVFCSSITLLKNSIWNKGTSTFTITGTSTVLSNGNHFYNLKDSSSSFTTTFSDNFYVDNTFTLVQGNITWSGNIATFGGDALMDGTGTLNLGNGITMNGNNALLHIGSTVGTVTATSCVLTWNGISGTLDDDKGTTFKGWTLGSGASFTNSGAATSLLTGPTPLVFTDGGSLTLTRTITITLNATGYFISTLGAIPTITNTAQIGLRLGASGIKGSFPALNFSSTGLLNGFTGGGNFTNDTINYTGNISTLGGITWNCGGTGNPTWRLFTNGNSITCGPHVMGTSSAGSTFYINRGSSVFDCKSLDCSANTLGSIIDSMGSSKTTYSGSVTFATGYTHIPMTSIMRIDSTSTMTFAGQKLNDFRNVGSSSSKVTLADSLQCAFLYDSSGKFVQNSKNIYVDSNYVNVSPDSAVWSANLTIGKSYFRNTAAVFRTGGDVFFNGTKNGTITTNGANLPTWYFRKAKTATMTLLDNLTLNRMIVDSGIIIQNKKTITDSVHSNRDSIAYDTTVTIYQTDSSGTTARPSYGTNALRVYATGADTGKVWCNGKSRGNIYINSTKQWIFMDTLKCGIKVRKAGIVKEMHPMFATALIDSSTDSLTADSARYISGVDANGNSLVRVAGAKIKRGPSMINYFTGSTHKIVCNNGPVAPLVIPNQKTTFTFADSTDAQKLTAADSTMFIFPIAKGVRIDTVGDISGSAGKLIYFRSSLANNQARFWIPGNTNQTYAYWKDICVQGGTITCPWSSGCRSGGGGLCP